MNFGAKNASGSKNLLKHWHNFFYAFKKYNRCNLKQFGLLTQIQMTRT
jgi:hypothetical protein